MSKQKRNTILSSRAREALNGYLFTSPWVLGFLIFVVGPMIGLIWLSSQRWDLIGDPRSVGLRNYERLLTDRLFHKSLEVTVIYGLGRVPLGIFVALGTALLLNNRRIKFIGIWRTIYCSTSVIGIARFLIPGRCAATACQSFLQAVLLRIGQFFSVTYVEIGRPVKSARV